MTAYGGKYLHQLEAKLDEEECKHYENSCLSCQSLHVRQHFIKSFCLYAVWLVYEQIAIAALDCRASDLASKLVTKIRKRFPKASRTHRLTVSVFILLHLLAIQDVMISLSLYELTC